MPKTKSFFLLLSPTLGSMALALPVRALEAPDFARDVRPILASHCFKCHGQDAGSRKSGLRLDGPDATTKPAKSGVVALVPGHPGESEAIRRILSTDPDEVMPPPSAKHPLTADQQDILRRWVAAGAAYQDHWAFVAPRAAAPPAVRQSTWPRGELDQFILARLEAEGLAPSPEADRATLIRRVSLDLIGLPPTVEEADAFLADPSPDAYEALVDRLLASPHYGERWARRWLDLARYADTNGYEKDRPRSIWPWRDWVIRALNADMPFDQFTVEQLAGDLLPERHRAIRSIATGFHRNTMLNEEGGIDPLEFRFHAMTDRVADHRHDLARPDRRVRAVPHPQVRSDPAHASTYQLMAFLNNADEPFHYLPREKPTGRRREREEEANRLQASLAEVAASGP